MQGRIISQEEFEIDNGLKKKIEAFLTSLSDEELAMIRKGLQDRAYVRFVSCEQLYRSASSGRVSGKDTPKLYDQKVLEQIMDKAPLRDAFILTAYSGYYVYKRFDEDTFTREEFFQYEEAKKACYRISNET